MLRPLTLLLLLPDWSSLVVAIFVLSLISGKLVWGEGCGVVSLSLSIYIYNKI